MLRQTAQKAVKWTSLSAAVKGAVHFIQYAALARYLTPDELGSFGVVMLIIGFGQMYTDGGMANAIIHFQDLTREQLSTLYWFNVFLGAVLYGMILIGAPFMARFFHARGIVPLCYWAGLVFLIIPLGMQFQALLQRELHFDRLAKIHVVSSLAGGALAMGILVSGGGAFSLIVGLLATTTVKTGLLLGYGLGNFRPMLHFSLPEIRPVIRFGLFQVSQKLVGFIGSRADQFIIGRFLGLAELGFYNLAYNLVVLPIQGINPIITRVAFPIYAKIQNESGKLVRGYSEMLKVLALVNFPFFCLLAIFSKPVILIFYGKQWLPSSELIRILAMVAIFFSLSNPIGSILLAKGRADLHFKWDLFVYAATILVVGFGARFGVGAIAWSLLAANAVFFVLEYFFVLEPVIGEFKSRYFVGCFLVPMAYSIASGTAMIAFGGVFQGDKYLELIGGAALGAVVYLSCIAWFEKPLLKQYLGGRFPFAGAPMGWIK